MLFSTPKPFIEACITALQHNVLQEIDQGIFVTNSLIDNLLKRE